MVLTYINPLNRNYKGEFIYEFLFSKGIDINFGDNWDVTPASVHEVTPPPLDAIEEIGVFIDDEIELDLTIHSDTFGMYDAVENIIALGWEKESPPSDTRLVFHYGETKKSVIDKLYSRDKKLEIKDKTY